MNHNININWKEGMLFEAESMGGSFMISSEDGEGLRPKALMLDALGGCTAIDVVSLINKMRLEVEDYKVEVNANLTEEHPKYYNKVFVKHIFKGTNLDEEKLTKAVNLSSEKYCGVMEMFRKFSDISIEIIFEK